MLLSKPTAPGADLHGIVACLLLPFSVAAGEGLDQTIDLHCCLLQRLGWVLSFLVGFREHVMWPGITTVNLPLICLLALMRQNVPVGVSLILLQELVGPSGGRSSRGGGGKTS
jgi:hypothetical protein